MFGPVPSLYDSDTASLSAPSSSQPSISNGVFGTVLLPPPIPKSSGSSSSGEDDKEDAEGESVFRTLAKRLSSLSSPSLATNEKSNDDQKTRQRASFILHSSSTSSLASSSSSHTVWTDKTSHTAPPIPTIPPWALNSVREEAGAANRTVKYGNRRGTIADFTPSSSLPPSRNQPTSRMSTSDLPNQPRPVSVSLDPTATWMSAAEAPKFSRHGLAGNGVVMPMSKRESMAKMKSVGSIRTVNSTATLSQPAATKRDDEGGRKPESILRTDRRDDGVGRKSESIPRTDATNNPDVVNTKPKEKEKEKVLKRASLPSSFGTTTATISVSSSAGGENVPPLPRRTISKSDFLLNTSRTSLSIPSDSAPETFPRPPSVVTFPSVTRRSATLARDSVSTAIDDNPLHFLNETPEEFARRMSGITLPDTQETRPRQKSFKQIFMRITTVPMSAGKKSKPTKLPPDTLMPPLDPPPGMRFEKPVNLSVQSLPLTKEVHEFGCNQAGVARGNKRFKGIKKKWNAVLATVKGQPDPRL